MSTKKNVNKTTIKKLESMAKEKLSFGNLLRAIRLGEEMSQVEFADLLGISKQYLCGLEKGRKFVSPKVAANFALKLHYSDKQFIRLCLQDMVDRDGFNLIISVEAA